METWPKSGKAGKARGYKEDAVKNENTGFYEAQGVFAQQPEHERMNQYAKPGTSAGARQSDPYDTSYPISRYKSRWP
jgi:hypothetical protein